MTQHEYVFVAVSIILGLAITRLLNGIAMLIRARRQVVFHWASALWAACIASYVLQLWWVGWGLRELSEWSFSSFLVLIFGSTFIYGAAEMALPVPDKEALDMLHHNQHLGRFSAASMAAYFAIGPYFNLAMYHNPLLPSLLIPAVGIGLMLAIILKPQFFKVHSVAFTGYSFGVLYLTA